MKTKSCVRNILFIYPLSYADQFVLLPNNNTNIHSDTQKVAQNSTQGHIVAHSVKQQQIATQSRIEQHTVGHSGTEWHTKANSGTQ